ncbi:MAG: proton-conducting transporter membrane subunit [Victivallales bacterium]|jgi:hydrogenase-4 component F
MLIPLVILTPLISAAACFFAKSFRAQYYLTLSVSVFHLVFSLTLFMGWLQPDVSVLFSADSLSQLFLLVLSNVYFWVVLVSLAYLRKSATSGSASGKKHYFLLLNFYLSANTAAILSSNFGMYWVASEATTLSVAPLIYYYRNEEALEAMWKYLFLVSLGIAFAFIGILFLTLSANGTVLEGRQLFFSEFAKNAALLNPVWLKASFIFIFVGMSTKVGIAPMHSADVDATSNSPSPVAALMAGSLRITALLGVMRIFQIVTPSSIHGFAKTILVIGGMFSLFVAFVFMFKVKNYKRMLAYSSVEHLGIITLAVGIGGLAFVGAIYHIVYNSLCKVVLFFIAGNVHREYKTREIAGVSSVIKFMPWTGWLLLLAFFAISAIPPFGIFFSELMIFEGMLFSGKPWVLAVTMFLMLFIFINMGRALFQMLYREDAHGAALKEPERFDVTHFASVVLLILAILIAVMSPDVLRDHVLSISKDFGIKL